VATPLKNCVSKEKIIRRGRALQRQTSRAARTSRSDISRGIASLFVPRTPSIKSTSGESSSFQKIVFESEDLKGDEPSIDFVVINPFPENFSVHRLGKEAEPSAPEEDCSSFLNSLQTKPEKIYTYTHTSLPMIESILQNLFVKEEENLALLLGQFYKASNFPDPSEFTKTPLGRIQLTEDEEAEVWIQISVYQFAS
jgi:hypothetical protein